MTFHTFSIAELPEDADDDVQLEFTTGDTMLGLNLSETEARAVGEALLDACESGVEDVQAGHVDEIVAGDSSE